MRVMPSVTETIEPTLRASVTDLKFSMRCLMSSLISVALMAISSTPGKAQFNGWSSGRQLVSDALEPGAQRAIDHQVPGAQHRTADELRVCLAVQPHLAPQPLLERCAELVPLRLIERRRRSHRDILDALGVVLESVEELRDLRQVAEAVIVGERAHEVCAMLAEGRGGDPIHEPRQLLRGHARIVEQIRHARI